MSVPVEVPAEDGPDVALRGIEAIERAQSGAFCLSVMTEKRATNVPGTAVAYLADNIMVDLATAVTDLREALGMKRGDV